MRFRKAIEFEKRAAERELFGPVYRWGMLDTQGEFVSEGELAKAVRSFNVSGKLPRAIDLYHNGNVGESLILESYIAKSGGTGYRAGDWLMTVKASDTDWQEVEKGNVRAFSMSGRATRTEKTFNGKAANELSAVNIETVSLVAKGANKSTFIAKSVSPDKLPQWAEDFTNNLDKRINRMFNKNSKQRLSKQDSFNDYSNLDEITVRLELLHNKLFNSNGTLYSMPEYERMELLKEIEYWENERRVLRALSAMES